MFSGTKQLRRNVAENPRLIFKSVLSTHWTKLAAAGRQNRKEGLLKVGSKSDTAI
jgi:hypothetical protein